MKFTIRDLLWLTLLAAVIVAWWVDRRTQAKRIDELEKRAVVFSTGDIDLLFAAPAPGPAGSPPPAP